MSALAIKPRRSQLAHGDAAQLRRDVFAAQLGYLAGGRPRFGVAFGRESALVGLPSIRGRGAVAHPPALARFGLVRLNFRHR